MESFKCGGYRVYMSEYMAKYKLEKRSLLERFFSLPWHPMKRFNQVECSNGEVVMDRVNKSVYASPMDFYCLKRELERRHANPNT